MVGFRISLLLGGYKSEDAVVWACLGDWASAKGTDLDWTARGDLFTLLIKCKRYTGSEKRGEGEQTCLDIVWGAFLFQVYIALSGHGAYGSWETLLLILFKGALGCFFMTYLVRDFIAKEISSELIPSNSVNYVNPPWTPLNLMYSQPRGCSP